MFMEKYKIKFLYCNYNYIISQKNQILKEYEIQNKRAYTEGINLYNCK
jgi:hypothetical protein